MLSVDSQCEITWEVPRFDGWYNSLGHARRGAVGKSMQRAAALQPAAAQVTALCLCSGRLSPCAPGPRTLPGWSLPAGPGASAAESPRTEPPAQQGTLRPALNPQPDRARSVFW